MIDGAPDDSSARVTGSAPALTLETDPKLSFSLALLAGVVAQSLARHLHLPGIVVLLIAGVSLGPDGLGWVQPRELGDGLFTIVDFAVAVILFEGALTLRVRDSDGAESSLELQVPVRALNAPRGQHGHGHGH